MLRPNPPASILSYLIPPVMEAVRQFRFAILHPPQAEKAMAPHSSTLAWKIPWMEEPGRLQSMGSLELDTTERLPFQFSLSCTGEGNGNPLQCSCLKNPRDGGAWWATVFGVAQSWTRLKRLSSSSSSTRPRDFASLPTHPYLLPPPVDTANPFQSSDLP